MATPSRSALLTKVHKVLKKHYKPVAPSADRTVLQHMLFACCLENSPPEAAEKAYQQLVGQFFDWNEVRVSTVRELAEVVAGLKDPAEASQRVKKSLQSVFESQYSFDMEALRKQNLGAAEKTLASYKGSTPFVVGYVVQAALGGHSIAANAGALQALQVVGVISPAEAAKGTVPGMERAIPKSKGVEFASLLHQLGVEMAANPYGPGAKKILLEIDPDCKDRLPKRPSKASKKAEAEKPAGKKAAAKADKAKAAEESKKKTTAKKSVAKKAPAKKTAAAKTPAKKKPARATAAAKKKSTTRKSAASKSLTRRKPR